MFASPFARVYFSVTADISLFWLLWVSKWDKKLNDLWAFFGSKQCTVILPPPPSIPSSSSSSYSLLSVSPFTVLPRVLGRSLGRQCTQDGWGDGGWTNRKHLSPIMTEENHISWFAWHFSWGWLIWPSHSSIHLVTMRGHLSHPHQRAWRKIPGGNSQNRLAAGV